MSHSNLIHSQLGVNFINCFMPYAELWRLAPNFCASKKLLKSWALGVKVGRRGAKLFMTLEVGKRANTCISIVKLQQIYCFLYSWVYTEL